MYLWILAIAFSKIRFWKTYLKTHNGKFVFLSLQYKFQVEIILVSLVGYVVFIGLQLLQLVDKVEHEVLHYQNRGFTYLPKLKMTQT